MIVNADRKELLTKVRKHIAAERYPAIGIAIAVMRMQRAMRKHLGLEDQEEHLDYAFNDDYEI